MSGCPIFAAAGTIEETTLVAVRLHNIAAGASAVARMTVRDEPAIYLPLVINQPHA
jgi:hypothetical protein